VVASEVKELANQTSRATDEISAQIASVQQVTAEAVQAIQAIASTIGEMSQISVTIAAAMEKQGAATAEISRNVQEAAHGTEVVTGSIGEVRQATGDTGEAASQVLSAAQELARHSAILGQEVDHFLSRVKAALVWASIENGTEPQGIYPLRLFSNARLDRPYGLHASRQRPDAPRSGPSTPCAGASSGIGSFSARSRPR
jgi:hypothetical protein